MIRFLFRWISRCAIATLAFAGVLLLSAPFVIYTRFNAEYPIAKLEFFQVSPQEHLALLRTGNFCHKQEFLLRGDQWQLDAQFLRWKGLAVGLGLDAKYRLERLSGRYRDTAEQNTRPQSAHNLAPEIWFDFFTDLPALMEHLIDARFGSSVYMEIDTRQLYTVYRTEDALIVKAKPRPAPPNDDEVPLIEINNACLQEEAFWSRLVRSTNKLLTQQNHVTGHAAIPGAT